MLSAAIILATFIALVLVFAKPKLGSFVVWFILFTYPHNWWYRHGFLPLNIGVDDLFCILLFLIVVVKRNIIGQVPIRFGYGLGMISLFSLVAAVANLSGATDGAGAKMIFIKDTLKLGVYWGLFYAILHSIDDVDDLRRQFLMFSAAAALGGVLVILHYYYPSTLWAWSNPMIIEERGVTYEGRATGPFLNPNGAGCMMACCLALVITALRLQRKASAKVVIYVFAAILLVGLLMTKSRGGLLAMGGVLILMALFGQNRKVAWMVLCAAVVVWLFFAGIRQTYQERVMEVYNPATGSWGENVAGRFRAWRAYFETASAKTYVFGQGPRRGTMRNGAETHSAYVALITVYGFGGVIWAILGLVGFFKRVWRVRLADDPVLQIVGAGCLWGLLAWGLYAVSSDALSSQYPRYILFYVVCLVDRAHALYQEESWELAHSDECELSVQDATLEVS